MDKKCYMFFDDGCSTSECDINYKEDGTFSVVGTAEKKNKDGQVDHVHSINLSGNYIGGGNYYGYTLIVDDKAYIYTEHNAYRDDNLSDSPKCNNSGKREYSSRKADGSVEWHGCSG